MTTAEIWEQRVEAWRQSGEPASSYAAAHGYTATTLRHWARRLRRPADAAFLRLVPRVAARPVWDATSAIVVEVGRARLHVSRGFDGDLLRDLVRALATVER